MKQFLEDFKRALPKAFHAEHTKRAFTVTGQVQNDGVCKPSIICALRRVDCRDDVKLTASQLAHICDVTNRLLLPFAYEHGELTENLLNSTGCIPLDLDHDPSKPPEDERVMWCRRAAFISHHMIKDARALELTNKMLAAAEKKRKAVQAAATKAAKQQRAATLLAERQALLAGATAAKRVLNEIQMEKKKLLTARKQMVKLKAQMAKLKAQTGNGKRQRGDAVLWRWGVVSAINCDAQYTPDERDDEDASNVCSECNVGYHAWCSASENSKNSDAFQRLKDTIYTEWKESRDDTAVRHCPMCRVRRKRCPPRPSKRPRVASD